MLKKILNVLTVIDLNQAYLKNSEYKGNCSPDVMEKISAYNIASNIVSSARFNEEVMQNKKSLIDYIKDADRTICGTNLFQSSINQAKELAIKALNKTEELLSNDPTYFDKSLRPVLEKVYQDLIDLDYFEQILTDK